MGTCAPVVLEKTGPAMVQIRRATSCQVIWVFSRLFRLYSSLPWREHSSLQSQEFSKKKFVRRSNDILYIDASL